MTQKKENKSSSSDFDSNRELLQRIEEIKEGHEKHDLKHKNLLDENLHKINNLELRYSIVESSINEEINKTKSVYDDALKEFSEKKCNVFTSTN